MPTARKCWRKRGLNSFNRGQAPKFISAIILAEIKHMEIDLWQGAEQKPVAELQAPYDTVLSYQLTAR